MASPKSISVAMCTFNGQKFLGQQLASIASQTRPPTEVIIRDDCSTDSTVEIINSFAATAPFPVKLTINEKNLGSLPKGITRNFELATQQCCGQLIAPCDQDDIWFPSKLSLMAEILENDDNLGLVFSDAQLVNEEIG